MFVLFSGPLWAAEEAPPDSQAPAEDQGKAASPFFPILPLILTAGEGELSWKPDWPLGFPPDAFSAGPGWSSITIKTVEGEYRIRRSSRGFLEEFPVLLDGALVQVRARFDSTGEPRSFSIASSPERTLEFLNVPGEEPALIRLVWGEQAFFIATELSIGRYTETWYDAGGGFQGFFQTILMPSGESSSENSFRIIGRTGESADGGETGEWYHHDSFGNVSEISGAAGRFSALYTARNIPRYWEYGPVGTEGSDSTAARFFLQWDERGLLVRLTTGEGKAENGGDGTNSPEEYRYEYTLDSRGNWIERRERQMVRRFGAMAPVPGSVLVRIIEYGR